MHIGSGTVLPKLSVIGGWKVTVAASVVVRRDRRHIKIRWSFGANSVQVRRATHCSGGLKSLCRSNEERHIQKRGGASLAREGDVWRSLHGHEVERWKQTRWTWSITFRESGGQGVRSDPGSEGPAEKHWAAIEQETPMMNRSANGGRGRACLHRRRRSHSPGVRL